MRGSGLRILTGALAALSLFAAAPGIAHVLREGPPPAGPVLADRLLLIKHQRKLFMLKDGRPIREYRVSLGRNPAGHKRQEGDGRTPEGRYLIDWRNAESSYHLSMRISYPNDSDVAQARARNVPPGGQIMIHGLPNGRTWANRLQGKVDWTEGCVAVTNAEIEELWHAVPVGTPIEILP